MLLWSTAASAFELTLRYMDPTMLVLLSSSFSFVVLLLLRLLRGGRAPVPFLSARAALAGFLNPFLYYLVLLGAYDALPGQVAMVVNYLWPVTLVLLSVPVLGQSVGARGLAGVLVSFAGVVVLALGRGREGGVAAGPVMLALLSTVIWASYWLVCMRWEGRVGDRLLAGFAWGLLYLLAWTAITDGFRLPPVEGFAGCAWVGLFEMSLTFLLWLTALSRASSTAQVGSLIYLTPFVSLVWIALAVGERIGAATVAGLALVVIGIILADRGRGRSDEAAEPALQQEPDGG